MFLFGKTFLTKATYLTGPRLALLAVFLIA